MIRSRVFVMTVPMLAALAVAASAAPDADPAPESKAESKAGKAAAPSAAAKPSPPPGATRPAPQEKPSPAARLKTLYGDLAKAPDAATAEKIVQEIEQLWGNSGSPTADLILRRAIAAAEAKRPELALQFLDQLVELNPEWAEGFSRRAFVHFIKLDYARALGDLRRVLALDPGHFRALEGLVQILRTMGQSKAALEAARELVKAHPYSPGAQETLKDLEREVDGQGI